MSTSSEYCVWVAMKQRCTNPNHMHYGRYGGRGIKFDPRWNSFENFYIDMGPRPKGHTLDRIDNDGGYNKDNCQWVTRKTQARNRTNNRVIEFNGESKTVAEWAEALSIKPGTLLGRLNNHNWDVDKALTEAVAARTKDDTNTLNRGDTYEWNGECHTLSEWSRKLDIPIGTLYSRVRFGYSLDDVFTKKEFAFRCLTHKGETKPLSEWATEYGLYPQKVRERLSLGWSVEEALTGRDRSTAPITQLTWNGETKPLVDWAKELGMSKQKLNARIKRGWSVERALTTP